MLRLKNANGLVAEFSPMGASLQRFLVSDKDGGQTNIVMSPTNPKAPRSAGAYAGAILGPTAGRVENGIITSGGATSFLDKNDGQNHLHGGTHSLSDTLWVSEQRNQQSISFRTRLPDGLDGYPGNRVFEADYVLSNANELILLLRARSDRATWLNLSTHIYWNLRGNLAGPVTDHLLQIPSGQVVINNPDHTTNQLIPVVGTIFDFRRASPLAFLAGEPAHPQIRIGKGLNNLFLLDGTNQDPHHVPVVLLAHPATGRRLMISTSLPCQWVYTGGYLSAEQKLLHGKSGTPHLAVAFEPQLRNWPASNEARGVSITPRRQYSAWVKFRFSQPDLPCAPRQT